MSRNRMAEARSLNVLFVFTPQILPRTEYVPHEFFLIVAIFSPKLDTEILGKSGVFGTPRSVHTPCKLESNLVFFRQISKKR